MTAALRLAQSRDLPDLTDRIAALERNLLTNDGPMTPHQIASRVAFEAIANHYRDSEAAPVSRLCAVTAG